MRYDTKVYFQKAGSTTYNPSTGNYEQAKPQETMRLASVTDSGTETLQLVYGELKQGSKTILMQRPYQFPYDRIRIGEKLYRVDMSRYGTALVVSEVQ